MAGPPTTALGPRRHCRRQSTGVRRTRGTTSRRHCGGQEGRGRALENFGYVGCSIDVLDVLDRHCSGRRTCCLTWSSFQTRDEILVSVFVSVRRVCSCFLCLSLQTERFGSLSKTELWPPLRPGGQHLGLGWSRGENVRSLFPPWFQGRGLGVNLSLKTVVLVSVLVWKVCSRLSPLPALCRRTCYLRVLQWTVSRRPHRCRS